MRAKRLLLIASTLGILAIVASGCGGRADRPPATTSGPPATTDTTGGSRPTATPPPATTTAPADVGDESLASLTDPDDIFGRTIEEINADSPLEDVRFDFDSAVLSSEARSVLDQHAEWLERYPTVTLLVEGHCDERGTVEYNLALGERRANAAYDYLVSLGVSPSRLKTISYGKEFPLDPGHNEAAWARNRRAHFEITAK